MRPSFTQSGGQLSTRLLFSTADLSATSNQSKPQLYGSAQDWTLVWLDNRASAPGVYGYRPGLGEFLVSSVKAKDNPALYGDLVVWQDFRFNNQWDIYGYSISRRLEFPICTAAGNQMQPRVYGNRVVWIDSRNGGSGV